VAQPYFTFDQLQDFPALSPPARFAVIGDPIAHSKSPQMHNPALAACGIDAQYVRVQVPIGSVAEAFRRFRQAGFLGVNITIPHKFEALEAVDELDPLARRLGAVNTLAIRDGRLHGYNSDGPGFLRSLKEAFGVDLQDLRILILGGGGGAGRAVLLQCLLAGCQALYFSNRTLERSLAVSKEIAALRQELGVMKGRPVVRKYWDPNKLAQAARQADLIVNATSLGMKAQDPPLLPEGTLSRRHLVYDMVYRAGGETPLIRQAREAGARHTDGLSLLLHQGAVSFEHWLGIPAPLEVMRAGLREAAH
jgi:shikimate dehydrogenase